MRSDSEGVPNDNRLEPSLLALELLELAVALSTDDSLTCPKSEGEMLMLLGEASISSASSVFMQTERVLGSSVDVSQAVMQSRS